MTIQGKLNLLAMFLLPVGACVGAWFATQSGVWLAYGDTYIRILQFNAIISVPAALICAILIKRSTGDRARWLALLPSLGIAVWGASWYIFRGLFPAEVAAGAEYIGAPQYLMVGMLGALLLVLLLRVTGLVPRTA